MEWRTCMSYVVEATLSAAQINMQDFTFATASWIPFKPCTDIHVPRRYSVYIVWKENGADQIGGKPGKL